MIVDDLFPGSLGTPRWRTCQNPDPGTATKCQIPYSGEGFLIQIPAGSPYPPPPPFLANQGLSNITTHPVK